MIGAGNFARGVLLPRFKENARVSLRAVTTARGMTANAVAKQFGISTCAGSAEEILADKGINTVLIATRHNLHGPLVVEALKAGKHVFRREAALFEYGRTERNYFSRRSSLRKRLRRDRLHTDIRRQKMD